MSGAGRFAPSPTGPLHLGSLLAAVASFLDARASGARWFVRFDDLDQARNQPGAEAAILRALEAHALHWDGALQRQSEHTDAYRHALDELSRLGRIFYCACSRAELRGEPVYPGTCRAHTHTAPDRAARVRVDGAVVDFRDRVAGPQRVDIGRSIGDFVVRRRDGVYAYQLATAVDDGAADITRVIRGRDLLENTPRQLFLMGLLGLTPPSYGHVPLLRNAAGQKLSKQNLAPALDASRAADNLRTVLACLGTPADALEGTEHCAELLTRALTTWSLARVPRHDHIAPRE